MAGSRDIRSPPGLRSAKNPFGPRPFAGSPIQPALPPFLSGFMWCDLRGGITDAGIEHLIWGVTGTPPTAIRTARGGVRLQPPPVAESKAIYEQSFEPMIDRLNNWKNSAQGQTVADISAVELGEVFVRSTLARMKPSFFDVLSHYQGEHDLSHHLPEAQEATLRDLRNLGLIQHDGRWLFTPTRSARIWPTDGGVFLLQLWRNEFPSTEILSRYLEGVVRQVHANGNPSLLEEIRRTGRFSQSDLQAVRALRNLNLVMHEAPYLAGRNQAMLTELAVHILAANRQG